VVVTVHEAKTHLSRLLVQVEAGEDVVISRAGTPVARLVPVTSTARKPLLGALRGKIDLAGFDDPLPDDLVADFAGEGA
jgi:prevent-host-death family protein